MSKAAVVQIGSDERAGRDMISPPRGNPTFLHSATACLIKECTNRECSTLFTFQCTIHSTKASHTRHGTVLDVGVVVRKHTGERWIQGLFAFNYLVIHPFPSNSIKDLHSFICIGWDFLVFAWRAEIPDSPVIPRLRQKRLCTKYLGEPSAVQLLLILNLTEYRMWVRSKYVALPIHWAAPTQRGA